MQRYGTACRTGPNGKIYPVYDNARDVVSALERYLKDMKVTLRYGVKVTGITVKNGRVSAVQTDSGNIPARVIILAAGGSSIRRPVPTVPATGSRQRWDIPSLNYAPAWCRSSSPIQKKRKRCRARASVMCASPPSSALPVKSIFHLSPGKIPASHTRQTPETAHYRKPYRRCHHYAFRLQRSRHAGNEPCHR